MLPKWPRLVSTETFIGCLWGLIDNIEYRQGVAEEIAGVPDNSVDLVTCAQAAHWLQLGPFYEQLNRVLKPGESIWSIPYSPPLFSH